MAHIDLPVLPIYLYRYRRNLNAEELEQELRAITESHLYCAPYRKLNDSMEGLYEATTRVEENPEYDRIVKAILAEKAAVGICCFSDTHENELMWSHYAANYQGICVGYSPKKLQDGLKDDYHLVRLSYGLEPPIVTAADTLDARGAARKILSHKKASWVYEREWRIIGPKGIAPIESDGCIREIYIGPKLKRNLKFKLMRELQGQPIRLNTMKVIGYNRA